MTGPEHYAKAAACVDSAENADAGADPADIVMLLRFAQVHATLAVAAAIGALDAQTGPVSGYSLGREDADEWARVTAGETR